MRCADCSYFVLAMGRKSDGSEFHLMDGVTKVPLGTCHRNAPQLFAQRSQIRQEQDVRARVDRNGGFALVPGGAPGVSIMTVLEMGAGWPLTKEIDWCGEFEAKVGEKSESSMAKLYG